MKDSKGTRGLGSLVGLTLTLVLILSGAANGQFPGPPQPGQNPALRPPVSPYINILRSGNSPAINYYGVVRPEVNFSGSLFQLQTQQGLLANQQQDLVSYTAVAPTGHAAGFMTQSKYYMRMGSAGAVGGGYGAATAAGLGAPGGGYGTPPTAGFGNALGAGGSAPKGVR
jgi:hypothetical protein